MTDVYGGFEPERTVDCELGVSLPSNVEAEAKRLIGEIKRVDSWVDTIKDKIPNPNAYSGWKQWAKGIVDALVTVMMKSGVRSGVVVFPLWPVGGVLKALTVEADKALDDPLIGLLFEQLDRWLVTFKGYGLMMPGPEPMAAPGFKPPAKDGLLGTITKGALIVGGIWLGITVIGKLLESKNRAPQTQAQET